MSFNEHSHTVLYRGEHFHPTLARNFDVSDPLEWIARITAHIPRKGAKQVIYYGSYSQAWRGRERRQGILPKVPNEEMNRPGYSGDMFVRVPPPWQALPLAHSISPRTPWEVYHHRLKQSLVVEPVPSDQVPIIL